MTCLLSALLTATAEPNAHVPGWVKWIGSLSGGEALGLSVGAMAAVLWAIARGAVAGFKRKQAEAMKAADRPVAPLPPPAPPAPPADHEHTATRVKQLHLEAELVEAQEALRRLRRAFDEAAHDQASSAKALFAERAENERLRARLAEAEQRGLELVEQMRRERAEPPSLPPLRSRRDR